MENELLENIDKVHTTEQGEIRIRKNLNINVTNIVDWCKEKIKSSSNIERKGKNWYVYIDDFILTINAYSFTIITAHKS